MSSAKTSTGILTREQMVSSAIKEVGAAPRGDKSRVKDDWAFTLGVTRRQLERLMMAHRGRARGIRADAGEQKSEHTMHHVKTVFALKVATREKDRADLATSDAIALLELNGLLPPGAVSETTANRIARELGITSKECCARVESPFANYKHMFDGSGSKYLYPIRPLEEPGNWLMGIREREESGVKNLRLRDNGEAITPAGRFLLYYYSIVDHYSRLGFMYCLIAPGEKSDGAAQALEAAWRPKTWHPMRGLPEIVYTDKGPLANSEGGRCMLELLGVKLDVHKARNSQSKGAVERPFRTAWASLEKQLLVNRRRHIELYEWQEILKNYVIAYNAKKSSCANAFGRSRAEVYAASMREQEARDLPEGCDLRDAMLRTFERVVDASVRVQIDNRYYEICGRPAALIGEKVLCQRNRSGEVEVRHPRTMAWLPTRDFAPQMDGTYRAEKHGINEELKKMASELPPLERFLYETRTEGAAVGAGLQRARTVEIKQDAPEAGFDSIEEALAFFAEESGTPVWKLGAENERLARQLVAEKMGDMRAVAELAANVRRARAQAV
ncbi:MAG: Integrase core domain protein [bacterium ADurb.Bin236]|nr:MAG: Integrase core domain protein [bacterium ADurb.Bin236]